MILTDGRDFAFVHDAVRVLEGIRSAEARDLLLQISLGHALGSKAALEQWAASAYLRTLDDKKHATELLPSRRSGVQNVALLALKGQPIDASLWSNLLKLISSEEMAVRWATASCDGGRSGRV